MTNSSCLITPTRQAILDDILLMISNFSACTSLQNGLGLFNINHHAEDLFVGVLNVLYGWNLQNANKSSFNAPGIDLVDNDQSVIAQVTSERTRSKVQHSLDEIESKYEGYEFFFVCFNILEPPVNLWAKHEFSLKTKVGFKVPENIITIRKIVDMLSEADDDKLDKVWRKLSSFTRGSVQAPTKEDPITHWIVMTAQVYKRFARFASVDMIPEADALIAPEREVNWSIIELSADILTLKGQNLTNTNLVNTLDAVGEVCNRFASLSRIYSEDGLRELNEIGTDGMKSLLDVVSAFAAETGVDQDVAKGMYLQFLNS